MSLGVRLGFYFWAMALLGLVGGVPRFIVGGLVPRFHNNLTPLTHNRLGNPPNEHRSPSQPKTTLASVLRALAQNLCGARFGRVSRGPLEGYCKE